MQHAWCSYALQECITFELRDDRQAALRRESDSVSKRRDRSTTRLRRQVPGSEKRLIPGPIRQDHLSSPRPTPVIESRITLDRWNSGTGWYLGVTSFALAVLALIIHGGCRVVCRSLYVDLRLVC